MNTYLAHICWRFSSENYEYGLIKADSIEEAEKKLRELNPGCISVHAYEFEFDSNGYYSVYSH